ncbi:hypothetical protein F4560_007977 [Saccharothrix ecbatanensis]|uniref:Uncharacterized protein n=1 Tax=Saccharothrix ecbatanensis TaxID=1105145 RepID=A0A7W9HUJ3_9PSEU|nr:hypothetical protein [Saccharothrix ecbatanensis]MBB5808209.1 hypothetical protein [Saccharothrix ecbatanensis]
MTADLPMRVEPLVFVGRVEVRFGNAFPAVLLVDHAALPRLVRSLTEGQAVLDQVVFSAAGRHVLVEEVGDDATGEG